MTDESKNPWTSLSIQIVYDNKWITVTHEEVLTPGGSKGIYGKVHLKNYAIGIVPLDKDGNTRLVGQYRYPLSEYSWEIPEGGGLLENDILEAAQRELKEEAGLTANKWTQIAVSHTSNSVSDELAVIFAAQELTECDNEPDDTEQLQIKKLSLNEAIAMAMDGTIKDAISVLALLKLKILIDEGKFEI
ncbi:MAG: NUDIX hydrolase [Sphingobacteriales bacterium]|nr:NUDIX hydrolase [Sphingobacteriales bacterium]